MNEIPFPIVVYPSEDADAGRFTAHCLNMDVLRDDDTVEGAVSKLLETIEETLETAAENGADPFRTAPREYLEKLSRAKKIPAELLERIVAEANRRHAHGRRHNVDLRKCDLRQLDLQTA